MIKEFSYIIKDNENFVYVDKTTADFGTFINDCYNISGLTMNALFNNEFVGYLSIHCDYYYNDKLISRECYLIYDSITKSINAFINCNNLNNMITLIRREWYDTND